MGDLEQRRLIFNDENRLRSPFYFLLLLARGCDFKNWIRAREVYLECSTYPNLAMD